MRVRVARWGNSLGLRIPRTVSEDLGLAEGTTVDLTVVDGQLTLRPVRYALDDLLAAITPANVHDETAWDGPVGHEAW